MEDGWTNIVAHQAVVAIVVQTLCQHPELGRAIIDEGVDLRGIVQAALIHNTYKRFAREMADSMGGDSRAYNDAAMESSEVLLSIGFDPDVVDLTEKVGHLSLEPMTKGIATVSGRIIHYANDIVLGDKVVDIWERMDYLDNLAKTGGRYERLNQLAWAKFNGRGYFAIRREIAKSCEFNLNLINGDRPSRNLSLRVRDELGYLA